MFGICEAKKNDIIQGTMYVKNDDELEMATTAFEEVMRMAKENINDLVDLNKDEEDRLTAHLVFYVSDETWKALKYLCKRMKIHLVATQYKKIA